MKTPQLASLLGPAFRTYKTQIVPETYLGVRLNLQNPQTVAKKCKEQRLGLTWRDAFTNTAVMLMTDSGFDIDLAYVFDSEIHLLLSETCNRYGRDLQKTVSTLASHASLAFSTSKDRQGIFDCRVMALNSWDTITDYFSHQQTNCRNHAITSICEMVMQLTHPMMTAQERDKEIQGMDHDARRKYGEAYGVLFNSDKPIDAWLECGHLLRWYHYEVGDTSWRRRIEMCAAEPREGQTFYDYMCQTMGWT